MAWPRHFLGLPLHPLLVHFPLAFWFSVPVFDLLALLYGPQPWWGLALGMTTAGVAIGLFALITGLLDYIHLSDTGSNNVRLAAQHGVRTTLVWCVLTIKLLVTLVSAAGQTLMVACLVTDALACALRSADRTRSGGWAACGPVSGPRGHSQQFRYGAVGALCVAHPCSAPRKSPHTNSQPAPSTISRRLPVTRWLGRSIRPSFLVCRCAAGSRAARPLFSRPA